MSDGAHMGITAGRALGTVLGGKEQPEKDERATPEETRARIEAVPLFEGPKPWEQYPSVEGEMNDAAYSAATDAIAHAFLILLEEDESLLEPRYYPDDCEHEILRGQRMSPDSPFWDAMKERWPHADEWVGGASGFMVGFALNTALYVTGKGIASNPAIIEVGSVDSFEQLEATRKGLLPFAALGELMQDDFPEDNILGIGGTQEDAGQLTDGSAQVVAGDFQAAFTAYVSNPAIVSLDDMDPHIIGNQIPKQLSGATESDGSSPASSPEDRAAAARWEFVQENEWTPGNANRESSPATSSEPGVLGHSAIADHRLAPSSEAPVPASKPKEDA